MKKIEKWAESNIWFLLTLLITLILIIASHDIANHRRILFGYKPTWGGEICFLVIPVFHLMFQSEKDK
ncbi:hypothetical protein BKP56_09110 [Marinilactibacillus sp. 15R]|nr:hypothetical protein BKP56_09110 [Marinilactibacillus sp. 15R]